MFPQIRALRTGFNYVVPAHFMDMFDEREAELIICGLGEINVKDWADNSEYRLCDKDTPVVRACFGLLWFFFFLSFVSLPAEV